MSTQSDLHDTVDPGIPLSSDERAQAESIVDVLEDIPTITEEEIRERHSRNMSVHADEFGTPANLKARYRPARHDLPAFGEAREDCGVEIPHVCEGCGHRIDVGRTCAQSTCPRCGAKWVLERAPNIVARIMSAAKMKDGAQYKHHAAVSPPREWYVDADDPWQAALDAMGEFMDVIDMDGIVLPHPWSGAKDESEGFSSDHKDDRGEWKKRLFEGRDWEGDVREELEFRPHFHIIGATSWFPGGGVTEYVHEHTDWVIHRITQRNGSPISLGDVHDVARAVTYALSHCAIDTTGEHNRYRHKKKGSAYHAADGDAHEQNLKEAKDAVYQVAPKTLGIPSMTIECYNDVDVDDQEREEHLEELLEDEPEAPEDSSSEDDAPKVGKCRGDLCDIAKATDEDAEGVYIFDEDWQRKAECADEALEAADEWRAAGGWQGWTGQATLDGQRLEDNPPPD